MAADTPWFENRGADDREDARRPLRFWIFRALLVVALAMAFAQLGFAQPMPRAKSPAECQAIADVVWAARALHKNGVAPTVAARVLHDYYAGTDIASRLSLLVPAAITVAARLKEGEVPRELWELDVVACVRASGDLSSIFGVGT